MNEYSSGFVIWHQPTNRKIELHIKTANKQRQRLKKINLIEKEMKRKTHIGIIYHPVIRGKQVRWKNHSTPTQQLRGSECVCAGVISTLLIAIACLAPFNERKNDVKYCNCYCSHCCRCCYCCLHFC